MKGNLNIDNRSGVFHQDDKTARTENYNCVRKGSLTVETACVMPLILLTLMGLIYLSFFVHNRAWLTAAAYESAISGSMEGIKKNGQIYDTARMRRTGEYRIFRSREFKYTDKCWKRSAGDI